MKFPPYKILLAILDYVVIVAAFDVACRLSGAPPILTFSAVTLPDAVFILLYAACMILIFQNYHLYKINIIMSRARHIAALLVSFFYSVLGLAALSFFVRTLSVLSSRPTVVAFAASGLLLFVAYRVFLFRSLYIYFNKQEFIKRNVLIVGATVEAKNLIIQIDAENLYGLSIVGFIDDHLAPGDPVFESFRNLGKIKDIPRIVREQRIDEIFVSVTEIRHNELLKILDICKATPARVKVTSTLFDIIHNKVFSESYYDLPVARFDGYGKGKSMQVVKRATDVVGAGLGLVVLGIPFLIIGLLIKLTSRGPVLYKQTRIGKDGREFEFYKFRSMVVGSDLDRSREKVLHDFIQKGELKNYKTKKVVDESKITGIGRFIRKTSIDELPQLFNVLKGDMSLVGPRPCLPYELKAFSDWHCRRLSVLPGCTGLWQVSSRSEVSFDDMVLLDLYYIDNLSPWLDLQLILRTIPVMLFGTGGE